MQFCLTYNIKKTIIFRPNSNAILSKNCPFKVDRYVIVALGVLLRLGLRHILYESLTVEKYNFENVLELWHAAAAR